LDTGGVPARGGEEVARDDMVAPGVNE
jgi:hypothetical protein